MRPVAVYGAGAFGTALAICWAQGGRPVWLVGRDAAAMRAMEAARTNARRLPGVSFPESLRPTGSAEAIPDNAILVLAVPTQSVRDALTQLGSALASSPVVLAAKGIELATGALPGRIAEEARPAAEIGILSGPGFATEIARGLPTALTIAARAGLDTALQQDLSTATMRLYRSTDLVGVQMGGALKNVVAIACGIAIGAGLGESARAALMTRGFAEITRLGTALGARTETFMGLSGLGDLSLTCGSPLSRNFARGLEIGRGEIREAGKDRRGRRDRRGGPAACRAAPGRPAGRPGHRCHPARRSGYRRGDARPPVPAPAGGRLIRPFPRPAEPLGH